MTNEKWDRLDSVRPGLLRGPMPDTRSIENHLVEKEISRILIQYGTAYVSIYGFVTPYSSIYRLRVTGPIIDMCRVVDYMLPFDARPFWEER